MREPIPDQQLMLKIKQRLGRTGQQNVIQVKVLKGVVTLTGTIQFEHQRRPVLRAVSSVDGIQRVVDQIIVKPRERFWK